MATTLVEVTTTIVQVAITLLALIEAKATILIELATTTTKTPIV
jgi:hypothetical protein